MEMERVVADTPGYSAFLTRRTGLIRLTFDARQIVSTDCDLACPPQIFLP